MGYCVTSEAMAPWLAIPDQTGRRGKPQNPSHRGGRTAGTVTVKPAMSMPADRGEPPKPLP